MTKLIEAYRQNPTPANHVRLQAYINKHPMAVCLVDPGDVRFLKANGFKL